MYSHIDIWEVRSTLSVALVWSCQSWTKFTLQCSLKSLLILVGLLLRPLNATSTIYCVNLFMWSGLGFTKKDNYWYISVWHFINNYFARPISSRSFVSDITQECVHSKWASVVLLILMIALYFLSGMYFAWYQWIFYDDLSFPYRSVCKSILLRTVVINVFVSYMYFAWYLNILYDPSPRGLLQVDVTHDQD